MKNIQSSTLSPTEQDRIIRIMRQTVPFRFLSHEDLSRLIQESSIMEFSAMESIIQQGDVTDRRWYVLIDGTVELIDQKSGSDQRAGTIEPGHYFGEWEVIFDEPRFFSIRAAEAVRTLAGSGELLLDFIAGNVNFAQALAGILREKQGIFRAFDLFDAELMRGIGYGHISIQKLLPLYLALEPALHPHANEAEVLDLAALTYAVRRLPANVSSTFAFLIRDELPSVLEDPDAFFPAIATDARRRSIWEILPGKDLMVSRSGTSDCYDFITCLCLYATEVKKIRKRIYDARGIKSLRDKLQAEKSAGKPTLRADIVSLLQGMGFNLADAQAICSLWPSDTIQRLYEMVNHREMFSVDVRTRQSTYNFLGFSRWASSIANAVSELIGQDPADLDPGYAVHIISSNTHSVTNCLNPWYAAEKIRILQWAKDKKHQLLDENWSFEADLVYALARDYFKAVPGSEAAMLESESVHRIKRLAATASTGIEVQVIDVSGIHNKTIDPILDQTRISKKTLLVNIDFAFGEQAEQIIHQLILLFGKRIRSVNFLGKAGALVGKRGDILIPDAFIEQSKDQYFPVDTLPKTELDFFRNMVGDRAVHEGLMLTVKGTLLQNRQMLHFYKHLWHSIGIEMEGVFYHRQVLESIQTGVLSKDCRARFYYYVSDVPLDTKSNLSARLQAGEGIPPLYAITRSILQAIFSS